MESNRILRTVDELAEATGMTANHIRQQIREEKIRAEKRGKSYYIGPEEWARILQVDSKSESLKRELLIAQLQMEKRTLSMQLDAVRSFLRGASDVLKD